MNFWKSRKFRQGSFATALTIVGIVLIVAVGSVLGLLSERAGLQYDISEQQLYGLSEESQQYLSGLDKDVEIYVLNNQEVFASQDALLLQAAQLLQEMQKKSPRIKVEYVDLTTNPSFSHQYLDLEISQNQILVVSGEKTHLISPADLMQINYDSYGTQTYTTIAEQSIISAIGTVTSDKSYSIALLGGTSNLEPTGILMQLEQNGYTIEVVNLLTEDISSTYDMAVLAAPARDLTQEEADKLSAYLNNNAELGKTLFYVASAEQPVYSSMPILSQFLNDWGILPQDGVVKELNTASVFSEENPALFIPSYSNSALQLTNLPSGTYPVVTGAVAMKMMEQPGNGRTVSALWESSPYSTLYTLVEGQQESPQFQIAGPYPVLLVSQEMSLDTEQSSNLIVLSSIEATQDYLVSSIPTANYEYLVRLTNELVKQDSDNFFVPQKELFSSMVAVNAQQYYTLLIVFLVLIPLGILIIGIVVWVRRRHR